MVLVNANRISMFTTDKLFLFCVLDVETLSPVSSPFPVSSLANAFEMLLLCMMCSSYLSWWICYDYVTYSDHILVDVHI